VSNGSKIFIQLG